MRFNYNWDFSRILSPLFFINFNFPSEIGFIFFPFPHFFFFFSVGKDDQKKNDYESIIFPFATVHETMPSIGHANPQINWKT